MQLIQVSASKYSLQLVTLVSSQFLLTVVYIFLSNTAYIYYEAISGLSPFLKYTSMKPFFE